MLTENELFDLYRSMLRIRSVEETLANDYAEQQIRCPMHLCIGQEATAVGVCSALNKTDYVFSHHRAHGHYLAKGGNLNRMVAELYGKQTGCSGGMGGSMHLIDKSVGFLGSTPIVGGTIPLAVGAAWSSQLLKQNIVSVAFFGDGGFEQGVVHESLNFGSLHRLPVLFVCENNQYAVYTPIKFRQSSQLIEKVVKAQGWGFSQADGNDVLAVHQAAKHAVQSAREGNGPQFLEFHTYRWREHCGPNDDDHLGYREQNELTHWQNRCPIEHLRQYITLHFPETSALLNPIHEQITQEIIDTFEWIKSTAEPKTKPQTHNIFSPVTL